MNIQMSVPNDLPVHAYDVVLLLEAALVSFSVASDKFPQPNYVVAKLCEEAGEVARAYIHMAEGRSSEDHLRGEVIQLIGLALRLYFEGDQTIDRVAPQLGHKISDDDLKNLRKLLGHVYHIDGEEAPDAIALAKAIKELEKNR